MKLSNIESFRNLPDVEFVDKSVEDLLADMVSEYEQAYYETTGTRKTLYPGDPIRIWIYTQALRIYTAYQLIDFSAKQNLLKYAEGSYLDNLGARVGVTRLPASSAICTVRFTLSTVQPSAIYTCRYKSKSGRKCIFETIDYVEVAVGSTYVDTVVRCTELGTIGNGYIAGQINILVDPIPYVSSVTSQDISQGGADVESDTSLSERIFLKPESFMLQVLKMRMYFLQKSIIKVF